MEKLLKWRTMTNFEIRNNMAYASQMQFEVLRRALWAQQAKPQTVFNWQFWERAAHDPKMTAYLNHGVKAKMCETTPFVNTVGAHYVASRAQIEQACDSLSTHIHSLMTYCRMYTHIMKCYYHASLIVQVVINGDRCSSRFTLTSKNSNRM